MNLSQTAIAAEISEGTRRTRLRYERQKEVYYALTAGGSSVTMTDVG